VSRLSGNPSQPQTSISGSRSAIAPQAGALAEALVRDWLVQRHWQMLYERWHCRWGEIDLIVLDPQHTLAFVEVKARGAGNWDRNGLLAITPRKQEKLCKTAQLFLAEQPELSTQNCRFDVALVSWKRVAAAPCNSPIELGHPHVRGQCELTLEQYILGAFDAI
jgi:putative endonuclease